MITGHDSVYLHAGDNVAAVGRFLAEMSVVWPKMRVSVSDEPFDAWPQSLPPETVVLVARDVAMADGWDVFGYGLDNTGEGPFAVLYGHALTPLRVNVQEDPFGRKGLAFEPYEVLATGGFSLITVVTPDVDSSFSRRIRDSFVGALQHH